MDAVLLLLMAASGLSAVSSQVRHQFYFVYNLSNLTEAQKYCRERYTDLATIDNMEEVKILNNTAATSQLFWIGLFHDDLKSWKWSLSDTSFYRDGEAEFRQWLPGQPVSYYIGQHCTGVDDGGLWNDHSCTARFSSVCMDVRGLNVMFVYISTLMTWTEAQSYCRKHHTDLASVRNAAENQKVDDVIPAGAAWIGLFRDSWKWSDGSNSSLRYWAPGQPDNAGGNEDCVLADLGSDGKWYNDPCDKKKPFVCYSPLPVTTKHRIKVRLETKDSSLDLNDPAVMEQMLKEFQQRLKDQGVKGDVKLSWRKQADGKVFHKEEEETKKKKTRRKRDEF